MSRNEIVPRSGTNGCKPLALRHFHQPGLRALFHLASSRICMLDEFTHKCGVSNELKA
jgi:hypothetical protein